MGQEIPNSRFTDKDFQTFSRKLHDNLKALKQALARPGFGCQSPHLGAELELYMVDERGAPVDIASEVRAEAGDPNIALELNRYNLEYNFPIVPLSGAPFSQLEAAIRDAMARINGVAGARGGSAMAIGILPTLTDRDLGETRMTPEPRYRALSDILLAMRGGEFQIDIRGQDRYQTRREDLTLEGACTSFQVHFSFPLVDFVNLWNAMTLVTPLVLAVSTNSPFLMGRRLWHETRVPLFKQSTDSRRQGMRWHELPRVELGYDWVRQSPYELFAQRVYLYPPLIPHCYQEDPLVEIRGGGLPTLGELGLHNGTIWHWNRPIYCPDEGGHVRVEMRSLPAGPSAADMAANAAFHIGLAAGLAPTISDLLPAMPFRFVSENFYHAARDGIEARLIWPSLTQNRLRDRSTREIGESLLGLADDGLSRLGVSKADRVRMLAIIEQRIATGQTGSMWQLAAHDRFRNHLPGRKALRTLVQQYRQHTGDNEPVSTWPLP
ncbi:MAG: glutamate--cysteine ligase [Porticoccaceae bacterium]|nr:glutamate--cysteine ligase [Porticoccaceae bacterium]